ncbi:MAG TPA: hypothetical protein PKB10_05175 [Tepidisphaeraceae bacterium]|nr:hypothetical protein [Tepidisphaeraceae bacterium]
MSDRLKEISQPDPPSRNGKSTNGQHRPPMRQIEIALDRKRRLAGLIWWTILFLLVASAFAWLFMRFTNSLRVALVVTAFIVGYMLLMGWIVSGKLDHRTNPFRDDEELG